MEASFREIKAALAREEEDYGFYIALPLFVGNMNDFVTRNIKGIREKRPGLGKRRVRAGPCYVKEHQRSLVAQSTRARTALATNRSK